MINLGAGENISLPGAKRLATTAGDVIMAAGSTEKAVSKAVIISSSFGSGAGRIIYEKLSDGSIKVIEVLIDHKY